MSNSKEIGKLGEDIEDAGFSPLMVDVSALAVKKKEWGNDKNEVFWLELNDTTKVDEESKINIKKHDNTNLPILLRFVAWSLLSDLIIRSVV